MKDLLQKLFKINLWNFLFSLFNFLSNFLVIKILGTKIFGEFTIINLYVAIASLIFVILPANFAVYKYQDDPGFKKIYITFFTTATFIFSLFVLILSYLYQDVEVNAIILLMYATSLLWNNYFDVTFQATGKLQIYFQNLAFTAFFKCLLILAIYTLNSLTNINDLLVTFFVPQLTLVLFLIFKTKLLRGENFVSLKTLYVYLKMNFKDLTPYYFNSSLKLLQEQVNIFIFNLFVTKEVLGLFAIFIKSVSFFNSLLRTLEAFFTYRVNIDKSFNFVLKNSLYIGMVTQALFICFNIVYIYLMIKDVMLLDTVIVSFYFLLIVKYIMIRQKKMSTFNIKILNFSQVAYIAISSLLSLLFSQFYKFDLKSMLFIFTLASIVSQLIIIHNDYKPSKIDN